MKENHKKILLLGCLLICILQLACCGRSGDTEDGRAVQGSQADADTVYVAQSQEIEASQMSFVKVIGDTMYYTTGQQKEDGIQVEVPKQGFIYDGWEVSVYAATADRKERFMSIMSKILSNFCNFL